MVVVVAVAAECVDKVRAGGAEYSVQYISRDETRHNRERDMRKRRRRRMRVMGEEYNRMLLLLLLFAMWRRKLRVRIPSPY